MRSASQIIGAALIVSNVDVRQHAFARFSFALLQADLL